MAQKFCQRALEMDPDNVKALETTGALLLEMGNIDAAKQVCNWLGVVSNPPSLNPGLF